MGGEAELFVESKDDKPARGIRATAEDAESAGLPRIKFTGDGKMMHLVSQQFIDKLKSRPPFRFPVRMSHERLLRLARGDEAKCAILSGVYDVAEEQRDTETGILQQYHDKGYTYFEIAADKV